MYYKRAFSLVVLPVLIAIISGAACAAEPLDFDVVARKQGPDYAQGLILEQQGKYDQAAQYYTKSISENPDHMSSYMGRARSFIAVKKYKQAMNDVDKYSQLLDRTSNREDKNWLAGPQLMKGNALEGLGQTNDAINCYKKALSYDDESVKAHVDLANLYLASKQKDLAKQEIKKAQEIIQKYKNYRTDDTLYAEKQKLQDVLSKLSAGSKESQKKK